MASAFPRSTGSASCEQLRRQRDRGDAGTAKSFSGHGVRDGGRFREQDLCHRHIASFRKPFKCVEDAIGAGIHCDG